MNVKLRKCPRCRSTALAALEAWCSHIPFVQTESGRWRRVWSLPDPWPIGVELRCSDCGHEWKPRNTDQVPGETLRDEEAPEDRTILPKRAKS